MSRAKMIEALVANDMEWFEGMSLSEYDAWVRHTLQVGLKGYNTMSDAEIVLIYSSMQSEGE